MNYREQDDHALIRLINQAHADALTELYDRYGRLVFSIAFNLLGVQANAEEVTLDIFQKVWTSAHSYRAERGRVIVWLTSMARNRAIDILRQEGVRPEQYSVSWSELSWEPPSGERSPETSADLAWQKRRVHEALKALPDEQRQALALAYFKGYSHRMIAEQLNVPLGTVKTRIRLAIGKLRALLEDE